MCSKPSTTYSMDFDKVDGLSGFLQVTRSMVLGGTLPNLYYNTMVCGDVGIPPKIADFNLHLLFSPLLSNCLLS